MQPRTFPPPLVVCAVSILPNLRRKLPPLTSWGNLILAHILQRNEVLFKISILVRKKENTLLIYYISMGRLGCICASPPVRLPSICVFKCKHKIYVKCLLDTRYLSQMSRVAAKAQTG